MNATTSANKLRVAILFTTLHRGGSETQAQYLINGINKKKYSVIVYSLAEGPLKEEFAKQKIPIRIFPTTKATGLSTMRNIRSALTEDKIDVLHCLLWHGNILGRLACRTTKVRCINSIRWAERIIRRDLVDVPTRQFVHWWIANSTHGAKISRLPNNKTTIIHNGLPDSLFKEGTWKPKPKTAIMIGQFRREKQYDILIDAARQLPDWQFTFVGDGPLLETTKKQAADVKNITFAGHVKNASQLMLTHSVAILLSKSEGTPNVALEAMALGVPFIGSDIAAHQELLSGGRGTIVKAESEAVVEALVSIEKMEPKKLKEMIQKAKKYVKENYNLEQMIAQTEQVWRGVTKK